MDVSPSESIPLGDIHSRLRKARSYIESQPSWPLARGAQSTQLAIELVEHSTPRQPPGRAWLKCGRLRWLTVERRCGDHARGQSLGPMR
jgi:hypothetical protein